MSSEKLLDDLTWKRIAILMKQNKTFESVANVSGALGAGMFNKNNEEMLKYFKNMTTENKLLFFKEYPEWSKKYVPETYLIVSDLKSKL